jgi:hypothetical protein
MQWVRAFLAGPSVHISQRKFIVPFQTFIFQEKTGPDAKAFSETNKSFRVCSAGQGVTKRCRLSWLTNSALVYEHKCRGRGKLRGLGQ